MQGNSGGGHSDSGTFWSTDGKVASSVSLSSTSNVHEISPTEAVRCMSVAKDGLTSPNLVCMNRSRAQRRGFTRISMNMSFISACSELSFISACEKGSNWKHAIETLWTMPAYAQTPDDASKAPRPAVALSLTLSLMAPSIKQEYLELTL